MKRGKNLSTKILEMPYFLDLAANELTNALSEVSSTTPLKRLVPMKNSVLTDFVIALPLIYSKGEQIFEPSKNFLATHHLQQRRFTRTSRASA